MKRILFLFSILVAINASVLAQSKITFDKPVQELGYLLWRRPVTVTFNFTNTGTSPLVISNVTTSCACAVADWTKEAVPAGGKGKVTATFDAEAIGRFYKEVGVYCNASSMPIYLEFNGEVTADSRDYMHTHPYGFDAIRLNQQEIEFNSVNKGEKPTFEILVANTSSKAYVPVLMHLPPYLTVKAYPEILGKQKNGKLVVTLDTEKLPQLGITRTSVYLSRFMGDKVGTENEIPVSVALLPDFEHVSAFARQNPPCLEISAKNLEFLNLKKNQKKSQTILITNAGKSNLEIQDMQVFSMALGVKLKKHILQPGETTKMKITVMAKNIGRTKGTPRILMITNDPQYPMVTIKVKTSILKE